MPRKPRSELVDGLCHVTARGNRRAAIFATPLDYFEFLLRVGDTLGGAEVACHGFCLMPNHVHLVLDAPQPALSSAMRRLLGWHAQRFNRRNRTTGHVFQGRFGSEPIVDESHLLEVVRYVVLNPVRARICSDPVDWPWSSYGAYVDATSRPPFLDTDFVLDLFGRAPAALAEFVADGLSAYPRPYTPANRSARRRTRSAAGSPTTLR